ncbi:MAG: XisI protein [Thermoanaerobaculia bacterium]|nr:XisI protein [Thermoanaerobaculia bacterium]
MDKLKIFHAAIVEIMDEYAAERRDSKSYEGLQFDKIIDPQQLHYQFVLLGWNGNERIYNIIFHIDIIDEKIWIQRDNIEESVAVLLNEKGISNQDIVLAYFPESHRKYTEYAVA